MTPLISVIIPIYNVEAYLERCLTSVIGNTYRNLEIICVNDGSPDGCAAILDRFAAADPRIQIITKKNGGISSARNAGLAVATGEYIAFIDSDDWVHPQYFEILERSMTQGNYDLVLCDFTRPSEPTPFDTYDPEAHPAVPLDLEEVYRRHDAKSFTWGRLYRKSLIGPLRFDEQISAAEDTLFMGMLLASVKQPRIAHIPLVLCYYFQRAGSLSEHISAENMLQIADVFFHCSKISTEAKTQALYVIETIKTTLSSWYMFCLRGDRSGTKQCKSLLKDRLHRLVRMEAVSSKDKLRYTLLCRFPTLYRLWRILNDPTLIAHEKNMYRRRRKS